MESSRSRTPKNPLTTILGVGIVVSFLFVAVVVYVQDIKPRISAEQEAVQKSYTFTLLCKVMEPITGIFQQWLIGREGENAWVYVAACLVESPDDIEIISNGVTNLLPAPQTGLHFIVIADSAPVSVIDWEKQFRDAGYALGDPNQVPPTKLTSYAFSSENMRLYMLNLLESSVEDGAKFKVLCREAIDQTSDNPRDWRPYHLCSSN